MRMKVSMNGKERFGESAGWSDLLARTAIRGRPSDMISTRAQGARPVRWGSKSRRAREDALVRQSAPPRLIHYALSVSLRDRLSTHPLLHSSTHPLQTPLTLCGNRQLLKSKKQNSESDNKKCK